MKKLIAAIACAAAIAVSLAGCGYQDALSAKTSSETETTTAAQSTEETVSSKSYDDSLDGLIKYFNDLGYIDSSADNTVEMDASLIGAKSGKKFTKDNVKIELYVYDTSKLDDTADKVIESVKSSGRFTILDLPEVEAYLSDNGKYLMIYTDSSISKDNPDKTADNYKRFENAVESFKSFKK